MTNDFKPDMGLALAEKYSKDIVHYFYSVKIVELIHVDENLYSAMTVTLFEGTDYALSFDFNLDKLSSLLNQLTDNDLKEYLKTVLLVKYSGPNKAAFYETPIEFDVKGKLGELVQSKYESFVPIIVDEFSNISIL